MRGPTIRRRLLHLLDEQNHHGTDRYGRDGDRGRAGGEVEANARAVSMSGFRCASDKRILPL